MTLEDDLKADVKKAVASDWTVREGRVVPTSSSVTFGTDAVTLTGTVLYADLADSTGLVKGYKPWFAAQVYKNYLHCAAKIIIRRGGTITAYDGDRIMAVFIGDSKNTSAVKSALQIQRAVSQVIQPAIKARYPTTKFELKQKVGIDTSDLFVVKSGIRGSDDLVWVGNAANNAAKLATLDLGYYTYISAAIYGNMAREAKYKSKDSQVNMWTQLSGTKFGLTVYGSTYRWSEIS